MVEIKGFELQRIAMTVRTAGCRDEQERDRGQHVLKKGEAVVTVLSPL